MSYFISESIEKLLMAALGFDGERRWLEGVQEGEQEAEQAEMNEQSIKDQEIESKQHWR